MAKLHYTFEDGQYQNPFTISLNTVLCHIDSAMAYNASLPVMPQPHCTCCGETENLVSGPAATGGTLYMCQAAAREALSRGE